MTQQDAGREINSGQSTTTSIPVAANTLLHNWLAQQASTHGLKWLLLHADTGIVWGEVRDNMLALSAATTLDWTNLHQARLFGENSELFVWQGPQGWVARLIEDGAGEATEWIDECQMLWGNREDTTTPANAGFTPIAEGAQGIVHAPPIGNATPTHRQRARLVVRHYIGDDEAGVARISGSRVVKLLSE